MSKLPAMFLLFTLFFTVPSLGAPPIREFDAADAPPFKMLKPGESPPLDVHDNFVIGPEYIPAPELKVIDGVPQGTVQQFTIDSKETTIYWKITSSTNISQTWNGPES